MSQPKEEVAPGSAARVVIVGELIFNVRLKNLVEDETDFNVVATADTVNDGRAFINEHRADLVVVDVNFTGKGEGVSIARDLNERRPGAAFMIVCGPFTASVAQSLWVYGTDSWSVITQATAKSPAHFAEAVSSAVHGITWVEPGVERELRVYGPRPTSFDERRLAIFGNDNPGASVA